MCDRLWIVNSPGLFYKIRSPLKLFPLVCAQAGKDAFYNNKMDIYYIILYLKKIRSNKLDVWFEMNIKTIYDMVRSKFMAIPQYIISKRHQS